MKRENIENKIQDLVDQKLPASEAEEIKSEIAKDEYLTLFYNALLEVDATLQHAEPALPSDTFTSKVMNRLHEPRKKPIDLRYLWVFIGILVCVILGVIYAPEFSLPNVTPVNEQLNLPIGDKVNVTFPGFEIPSMEVILNTFYFGILLLALIYFDRVILKSLFKGRKFSV